PPSTTWSTPRPRPSCWRRREPAGCAPPTASACWWHRRRWPSSAGPASPRPARSCGPPWSPPGSSTAPPNSNRLYAHPPDEGRFWTGYVLAIAAGFAFAGFQTANRRANQVIDAYRGTFLILVVGLVGLALVVVATQDLGVLAEAPITAYLSFAAA